MPRKIPGRHTEIRVVLAAAVRTRVCFRAVGAVTRGGCSPGHGPLPQLRPFPARPQRHPLALPMTVAIQNGPKASD